MTHLTKTASTMMKSALLINIIVLIPICLSLMMDAQWVTNGYGIFSPARGILLSIYISITIVSGILLVKPDPKFIISLLFVQIVYKITTPFTVGTIENPVVISNLIIALFHSTTLYVMYKSGALQKNLS